MNIYEKYKNIDNDFFVEIPGFDGIYLLNLNCQVKSVKRLVPSYGGGRMWVGDKILKNRVNNNGYFEVKLTHNNKHRNYPLHRLLAITFIPNPEKHPIVRHLDDVRLNLNISNLAWGTKKDNAHDSIKNGSFAFIGRGEKNHMYGRKGILSPVYGKPYNGVIRIGAKNPRSKLVFDTQTGIFYDTLTDASFAKGISISRLSQALTGVAKTNKTGLIYA